MASDADPRRLRWHAPAVLLALGVLAGTGCKDRETPLPAAPPARSASDYSGSAACQHCHADEYESWTASHHALAEMPVDPVAQAARFDGQSIRHGDRESEARQSQSGLEIVTQGADGGVHPYAVQRTIGVDPLVQFLVPMEGGRFQVTDLAVDVHRQEWFDVFGDERRHPGEWGFWTQRGMNWNSMCASCHNTLVQKNYDAETDTFHTTIVERGVACEACHGPGQDHVAAHERGEAAPVMLTSMTGPDRKVDLCGACHTRRTELQDSFLPGEPFLNAFLPELPGETGVYSPDGQVHDEDFEYVSFLLSRLSANGVTCMDCHDPHSARTRTSGNALCMRCHQERVNDRIDPIDPAAHSHHDVAAPGGQCVQCHMPVTVYMQRHPRHDHSFSVPDPSLTVKFGIPNACNRCHADRDAAWALEAAVGWYGELLDRPTRRRAELVARVRRGDASVVPALREWAGAEEWPAWRAVATGLLSDSLGEPGVLEVLHRALQDPSPLVRSTAASAVGGAAPLFAADLVALCQDPVRGVRVMAAWSLRESVPLESAAGQELRRFLEHNLDQPTGLRMEAVFWLARGDAVRAATLLQRAVQWDPYAAPLYQTLGVALSTLGKAAEAAAACRKACELDPGAAPLWYSLGLALNEAGDLPGAAVALDRATSLDPGLARGWYNLGLARHRLDQPGPAVEALHRAVDLAPGSAEFWYALASVYRDQGRREEALWAVEKALEADPTLGSAAALRQSLEQEMRGG